MPGAWVISPASVREGVRRAYVSTLEDKTLSFPHPQPRAGNAGSVLYEKYRTSDVVSVLLEVPSWTLSFVRTDDFSNLEADPIVHFVFDHAHEDGDYFLGKTFRQNDMLDELDALITVVEASFEGVAQTQTRSRAVDEEPLWRVLSLIGSILQPGWTPHGTYVAP